MYLSGLQNGVPFAHDRHVAFVEVLEWFRRRPARDAFANQLACVPALLKGYLSDSGERFAVPIERRRVANDEDFRVAWNAEVGLNTDASRSVGGYVEPLACGRGCDARGPDNRFAGDAFARDDDASGINLVDAFAEANFDA